VTAHTGWLRKGKVRQKWTLFVPVFVRGRPNYPEIAGFARD
jgi:hypothetical protein